MRTTLLLFLSLFVFSCNQPGNPVQIKNPAPVLENDTLRITKEYNGIYRNDGKRTFVCCDEPNMVYEINDPGFQLDSALKKILPNAYPGEGIFLHMQAEASAAKEKEHAGFLSVKEIIKTEQKNYMNTCVPYEYWCMGTEPFWQLQISKSENLIDFYNPMEQKTFHFLYADPQLKDGVIIYSATEVGNPKNKIQVSIYNEKCSDGMSEKQYNHRVGVILDRRYEGCGVKFGEKP